ncbi:MAG: hypothetical protein HKN26_03520 [Acidimicrobiales bacterium]|nr:hypothetical protein [Acidimicrobiales bacterium]
MSVRAGRRLSTQGGTGRQFVVVLDGQLAFSLDGLPTTILGSGTWYGALPLLERRQDPRNRGSVDALAQSMIAVATYREFCGLMDFPTIADRITTVASQRKTYIGEHARANATESAGLLPEQADYPLHA